MDPALLELIAAGSPGDEVAVIVRTRPGCLAPPALRVVASFGDIATGRAQRGLLIAIHDDPCVESLKAPRVYASESDNPFADRPPPSEPGPSEADPALLDSDRRRPPGLRETGRGTVIAVIDWGFDFAHPDFRRDDGGTRLLALWDQRAQGAGPRYGYGRVHARSDIDRALATADAFAALGYRASETTAPCHGTHVMGIAAGNGRAGGPVGVAPEADLVFIHLGPGVGDLGNSVDLLEAIDFAVRVAGERGIAINLSIGRHCGPHDGTLLVEQAIDWLIVNRPGTVVVQSTGNYYSRNVHAQGRLHEARSIALPFVLPARDPHPATVELWYKGADRFLARAFAPDGSAAVAELGELTSLVDPSGNELARLYHRHQDPNNGDNLVALILRPLAPAGPWRIEITGLDVIDGRWHAWIERNAANPRAQAQFAVAQASPLNTTGSICNAMRTIAVGAYDGHDPAHPLALFSSVGPTRDGRRKPLLAARGVRELSVRSRMSIDEPPGYVRMSGTSMAAPHVTGCVALMLEAAGRQPIAAIRQALFATLDPPGPAPQREAQRWGYGILNIEAAVAAARRLGAMHPINAASAPVQPKEAFAMAGNDFESVTPPMVGPPVAEEELRWTKGRRATLKTPEERVLSQFSDAELRDMLGLPSNPPIVVASSETDDGPATAPDPVAPQPSPPEPDPAAAAALAPTAPDPYFDAPSAPEPLASAPPPLARPSSAPPADPQALLNVAVNPQVPTTQVVGWPGARLAVPLIAGDVILRGQHRQRHRARMVRKPELRTRSQLARRAGKPREAGLYAEVFGGEGDERIAGPDGLLLPDVTIVRSFAAYGSESLPFVARPTMRIGSRGPAVSEVQARLNAVSARWLPDNGVGLDRCPLAVDGAFGPNTRAAVISFQRRAFPDQPQEWDGVVGQRTWAALIAASGTAAAGGAKATPDTDGVAPPVVLQDGEGAPAESPSPSPSVYLPVGANPADPLDRYRIRGGLYSPEYKAVALLPNGFVLTVTELGREERRLTGGGPNTLAVGRDLALFEGGALGDFVVQFNEFVIYLDEILSNIGRLRDLLSVGAPETPDHLDQVQRKSLTPTKDGDQSTKKPNYERWLASQLEYVGLSPSGHPIGFVFDAASTGRELHRARHAYWRAQGRLLRSLATRLDKPSFEAASLTLGDIASVVTAGPILKSAVAGPFVAGLVVLTDWLLAMRKARVEYDEKMVMFSKQLQKFKAEVADELREMIDAGQNYWDKYGTHLTKIDNGQMKKMQSRKAAANLGDALGSPRFAPQRNAKIRMPILVSDAYRALAVLGPAALALLPKLLRSGRLVNRAIVHFTNRSPVLTSEIRLVTRAYNDLLKARSIVTKENIAWWVSVDDFWKEEFNKFYR